MIKTRLNSTLIRKGEHCQEICQIGPHVLYLGDMWKIVPRLGKVDHVITDPPYSKYALANLIVSGEEGLPKKTEASFQHLTRESFSQFVFLCTVSARAWTVMTCDHLLASVTFKMESFIRLGAWVKTNPMPQVSADRPGQGHESILIHHSRSVPMLWNGRGRPAVWKGPVCGNAQYVTEKPLWLLAALVSDFALRTKPEVILDPMMGSGTTGVAVVEAGHTFVGIDNSVEAFRLAQKKIRVAVRTRKFFK